MKSPLYITGVTPEGRPLLGGIYRMQDECGFPIDASFEECQQKGYEVDWLEAMCDCWLNDCNKFDSFLRQAEMLAGANLRDKFSNLGAAFLLRFPHLKTAEKPVDEFCRETLKQKQLRHA